MTWLSLWLHRAKLRPQLELRQSAGQSGDETFKWSARRTFVFVIIVSLLGWSLLFLLVASFSSAFAEGFSFNVTGNQREIIVRDSTGGSINQAEAFFDLMADNGTRVRIEGTCASACTLALGYPNVCWSPRARFLFHRGTSSMGDHDRATYQMVQHLPDPVLNALPHWSEWGLDYNHDRVLTGRQASDVLSDFSRLC